MHVKFPPQHGAWAFLIVPTLMAGFLGAGTWGGVVFAFTWIAAYPVSYFMGRAIVIRLRRGTWSRKARTELRNAIPWLVPAAIGAALLAIRQPRLVLPAIVVVILWLISMRLTWLGNERGLSNDLVLVALAVSAPTLMWWSSAQTWWPLPHSIVLATEVSALFFVGSVVHVKSLIREANDVRWHYASIAFASIALLIAAYLSWWLMIPFGAALLRTIIMRPGLRPGVIGAVEAVVSVLVVVTTVAVGIN